MARGDARSYFVCAKCGRVPRAAAMCLLGPMQECDGPDERPSASPRWRMTRRARSRAMGGTAWARVSYGSSTLERLRRIRWPQ